MVTTTSCIHEADGKPGTPHHQFSGDDGDDHESLKRLVLLKISYQVRNLTLYLLIPFLLRPMALCTTTKQNMLGDQKKFQCSVHISPVSLTNYLNNLCQKIDNCSVC